MVDRLWPRGIKKDDAPIDEWVKDLAPSHELRKWYHENIDKRRAGFIKKYHAELRKNTEAVDAMRNLAQTKKLTFITSMKDVEKSHLPVLIDFLMKQ